MRRVERFEMDRHGIRGWIGRHKIISFSLLSILFLIVATIIGDYIAYGMVERRMANIRAAGEPAAADELQSLESIIPISENKTVAALAAVRHYLDLEFPKGMDVPLFAGHDYAPPTGSCLSGKHVEGAAWYLSQYPQSIEKLHNALQLPRSQYLLIMQSPMMETSLPELMKSRTIIKIIAMEACFAAECDDDAGTEQRILDAFEAVRLLDRKYSFLICYQFQQSLLASALDITERAINYGVLNSTQLSNIQEQLEPWCNVSGLAEVFATERLMYIDTLRWLETTADASSLQINCTQTGESLAWMRKLPIFRHVEESRALDMFATLIAAAGGEESELVPAAISFDEGIRLMSDHHMMSWNLLPFLEDSVGWIIRRIGMARALMVAIACEQYRIETGVWPETLSRLVPTFLPKVPADPFDNASIRYSINDEGIKVWSIGEDYKDNGGHVVRLEPREFAETPSDCGWVLLNPERRPFGQK